MEFGEVLPLGREKLRMLLPELLEDTENGLPHLLRTLIHSLWVKAVKERRGFNKAAVALAAKHARIIWSILSNGTAYRVMPA